MTVPAARPLPRIAAVDASFIVNVYEGVAEALDALSALKHLKVELVVPTPVWAEVGKGPGGLARLAAVGTAPAPLDARAATLIAKHLGAKVKANPCGRFVWDCDAQIFVCAVAIGCDAIVTDNLSDFESIKKAASPPFAQAIELWTSGQLARHAPREQMLMPHVPVKPPGKKPPA